MYIMRGACENQLYVTLLKTKNKMSLYETDRIQRMVNSILNLCLRKSPTKDFIDKCYDRFEDSLKEYIDSRVQDKILEHERGLFIADEDSRDSELDKRPQRRL